MLWVTSACCNCFYSVFFFSRWGRKFAVGSESGPSFYLFPEVRKSLCIFRSQLSTVQIFKAWNGSGKVRATKLKHAEPNRAGFDAFFSILLIIRYTLVTALTNNKLILSILGLKLFVDNLLVLWQIITDVIIITFNHSYILKVPHFLRVQLLKARIDVMMSLFI